KPQANSQTTKTAPASPGREAKWSASTKNGHHKADPNQRSSTASAISGLKMNVPTQRVTVVTDGAQPRR
ncbi:MAG TPA: hypothetical protein VM325_04810, partial [Alphaproteobacteria bacterium]|nr:hypothetical protein [Alphaproteobacteria bacterium]